MEQIFINNQNNAICKELGKALVGFGGSALGSVAAAILLGTASGVMSSFL